MSYEATGILHEKYDTQQVNDKFKKRELVLETSEDINGNTYTNYIKFQLTQAKCDILDRFNKGDRITVSFNLKGNKWEKDGKVNYISNLEAWRIAAAQGTGSYQAPQPNMYQGGAMPDDSSPLPF